MTDWPRHEIIPVAATFIDTAYQRAMTSMAERIANDFRSELFGAIIVSRRPDGRYAIIDGQQRTEACRITGRPDVPALIHDALTVQQEAAIFVRLQRERLRVRSIDEFRAELVACELWAVEVQRVLGPRELRVAHTQFRDNRPSVIGAPRALRHVWERGGTALLEQMVDAIRAAWPQEHGRWDGQLMQAVGQFISEDAPDLARLVEVLADRRPGRLGTPSQVMEKSAARRKGGAGLGGGSIGYTVSVIREHYGDYRRPSRRAQTSAR
jgi:hypothetical protein